MKPVKPVTPEWVKRRSFCIRLECYPDVVDRLMELEPALFEIAEVMNAGNKAKYQPGDWKENKTRLDHLKAADRHFNEWAEEKVYVDPETGLRTLAHSAARLLMALTYDDNNEGEK